jgi:ferredoxin--NADP+ reductase
VTRRPLRVAVIGAGPAGIFAVGALTDQQAVEVEIEVIDRLPTPFGLVRYGVAPDHAPIRNVRSTLERVLDRPNVRFRGNVELGRDVTVAELRRCFDAVVYAYGAAGSRDLGIPGEQLQGSLAASRLVSWYCGHPDAERDAVEGALRRARSAVIVGVGNVALDIARILLKRPADLESTDMPQHVLDTLRESQLQEVHLLGRRGPAAAAWTTKELAQLGELAGVAVCLDPEDLVPEPSDAGVPAGDKAPARKLKILSELAAAPADQGGRRLHLHFFSRPHVIAGTPDGVRGITIVKSRTYDGGQTDTTVRVIPADLVVRAAGYRVSGLPGLPAGSANLVPNEEGRVVRADETATGEYVAGWLKRGPSGVIGTNKADAQETVRSLLADADTLLALPAPSGNLDALLSRSSRAATSMDGWRRIDAAERALGQVRARERTVLHSWELLLAKAVGGAA